MIKSFINIFYIPELRKKVAFTSALLLVYRLGGHVPLPGLDRVVLQRVMETYNYLSKKYSQNDFQTNILISLSFI